MRLVHGSQLIFFSDGRDTGVTHANRDRAYKKINKQQCGQSTDYFSRLLKSSSKMAFRPFHPSAADSKSKVISVTVVLNYAQAFSLD